MSLFTAKGNEAKKSAQRVGVDLKTAYIKLKDGESVRVRVLGLTDYVEYMAHEDYNLGIYKKPCLEPMTGKKDPYCIAAASGLEGFEKLKAKKRYIFALWDIDKKQIRYWDASKTQAKKLMGEIEEYKESIDEIGFTFKRVGDKTETVFSLMPILKLNAEGKEGFDAAADVKVDESNFESVLIPYSEEQQIDALKAAGFPVEQYFGKQEEQTEVNDAPEEIDVEEEVNPTDEF